MKIVYPGTFDPFTLGHYDLTKRASKIYSHVTVAVSDNPHKHPMFSFDDRIKMAVLALQDLDNVSVVGFDGLLVKLLADLNARLVLRGVRGLVDFEYEFQMAQVNRTLLPDFEPVFLMPGESYMVLSSTFIRDLLRHNGDVSRFVHTDVYRYIKSLSKEDIDNE